MYLFLRSPSEWEKGAITITEGDFINRKELIKRLIDSRYERNDLSLTPGNFRVKGETIDLIPGYSNEIVRITLFGDEIEKISIHDTITLRKIRNVNRIKIFPAKHYITDKKIRDKAIEW